MYYYDMDWATVDYDFIEEKMRSYSYDQSNQTENRKVIRYLTSLLSAAIVLREHTAVNNIWEYFGSSNSRDRIFNCKSINEFIEKTDYHCQIFCIGEPNTFLVAKDKYGLRYFNMQDPELATRAILKLARERYDLGYYITEDDNYTETQEDMFKKPVETNHQMVARYLSIADHPTRKYWAAFNLFRFMRRRSGYEYENIYLEKFEI